MVKRGSGAGHVMDALQIGRMRADIQQLCVSPRNSIENPGPHRKAAEYISGELQRAGCSVDLQSFTFPTGQGSMPGLNVIGILKPDVYTDSPGRQAPALLIGSHYDTVQGSPGADDDASGIAVMLECARVLGTISRRQPIIFASFDAEERQPEIGLHGAKAYVKSLRSNSNTPRIAAAFILEMVGYSAPAGDQQIPPGLQLVFPRAFDRLREKQFVGNSVVAISNHRSRAAGRAFERAAKSIENGVEVLPLEIPRWLGVPLTMRRSDHAPFWLAGIPAVMVGDTANFRNPHYHTTTDTPETLDYNLMERVTRTVTMLTAQHATAPALPPRRNVQPR